MYFPAARPSYRFEKKYQSTPSMSATHTATTMISVVSIRQPPLVEEYIHAGEDCS